jgi:hypothetical protein
VLAISPDGSEMMVVYNQRISGTTDRDPYYTVFDGQNWSTPLPVLTTSGTDTAQLSLDYDSDGVAHLLLEEPSLGLLYMRYENDSWSSWRLIATTTLRLFGTSISAFSTNRIDAVWAAKPDVTQNPNIYHARSTDGGNTWTAPTPIAQSVPTSQAPKVAHDASGNVHVVWQESTAAPGFAVRYMRGIPWSQPVVISDPAISNARRPALAIAGNTLHLAFTRSITVDTENSDQWAYNQRCSSNCTVPGNWTTATNASGQPVRVNESAPFDLVPEIASHQGCTYIFFHGYVENVSTNEVIWDVNSCDSWSGGGRDQVTGFNMRGIYPRVAMHGDEIHLVYQWVSGSNHQIYYMNGTLSDDSGGPGPAGPDGAYLPFVSKP